MKDSCCMEASSSLSKCFCVWKEMLAPLLLRLALVSIMLPAGWMKTFGTPGYFAAVENIRTMSLDVVPAWFATFVAYTLPVAELYVGVALLLGVGKYFTKWISVLTFFAVFMFWALKDGAEFTWLKNIHTWYFIGSVLLFSTGFGSLALDKWLFKGFCGDKKCDTKKEDMCCGGGCC